jgi:hypothetical protein
MKKALYFIQNHGHGCWYDLEESNNLAQAKRDARQMEKDTGEAHRVIRFSYDTSFKPIIFGKVRQ